MRYPRLLLIDPGPERKEATLSRLLELPLELYAAFSCRGAWCERHLPMDRRLRTDPQDYSRLINDVTAFQASRGVTFEAVGTFEEVALAQTSNLAEALRLPGPPLSAIWSSSRAKAHMRQRLTPLGKVSPAFAIADDLNSIAGAARQVGFPCVVKPCFGESSYGVVKLTNERSLEGIKSAIGAHWPENYVESPAYWKRPYLVEEMCDGPLLAVDGIVAQKTISWIGETETELGPEPWFTHQANHVPPRVPQAAVFACRDVAKEALLLLGFDNCGFHCEFRVSPEGPRIIEIAARPPGGQIPTAYKRAYGIDIPGIMANLWLGRAVAFEQNRSAYVIQRGVFPAFPGILSSLYHGFLDKRPEWLWEFAEVTHPLESVQTYPGIPKPIYYYGVEGPDVETVAERDTAVQATVAWEVRPLV